MNDIAPGPDVVRVGSWNMDHDGLARNGDDRRWTTGMQVLAPLGLHVLLRQEKTRAHAHGAERMWAEAAVLGGEGPTFIPFLPKATHESASPTCVYVDPLTFAPVKEPEHGTDMTHPISTPVVRLKGAPRNLTLGSIHLSSSCPDRRASESRYVTKLADEALVGGDWNSPEGWPNPRVTPTDWREVKDTRHFQHRTIDGVSDTRPDEILSGRRDGHPPIYEELGRYAAQKLGQPQALEPTASLWRTDQGPMQRIDRIYATPRLAPALLSLEVIATQAVREASDHALVVATFSLARLRDALGA
ncbi:endonuclease/exonuclease/phosphatase family protein [Streptomyces pinistramenti]|uniref:endonuclease/exonuclease/phosphatase family protein n=1 Tax=Streptomyces pinistramenti TaxID=2884812 RepID=UPI001D068DB6|nr:endonuclease/exonuclease/phosphatase family protein [Streptomyces pinistramenti]MCB5911966.1 endonuclease/exonuclease/phosphatase family protein [Streptomyces pinistramenti]